MPIRTVEDLDAEILALARESLDAAGQDCARSGHAWKELETNAADGRPAAYSAICLSGIARGPTALGFAAVALFYAAVMAREEWTGCWRSRARCW